MLAASGRYWLDRRQPDSRWQSTVVSIAVTTALFVAALASMESTPAWIARHEHETPPVFLPLIPPPPAPKHREVPRVAPSQSVAPTAIPTNVAPSTAQNAVAAPASTTTPPVQHRDTANAPAAGAGKEASAGASAAPLAAPLRVGAPVAPAGVTAGFRAPTTPDLRTTLLGGRTQSIPDFLRAHPPTGRELAELQQTQRQADQLARRASTAGNSRDVHVVSGEGIDGAGVPGGGLSTGLGTTNHLPFSLFEPGPTAAQRKRDELVDADVRARFARLNARIVAMHDSVRADSLRRDSLARTRIIP